MKPTPRPFHRFLAAGGDQRAIGTAIRVGNGFLPCVTNNL